MCRRLAGVDVTHSRRSPLGRFAGGVPRRDHGGRACPRLGARWRGPGRFGPDGDVDAFLKSLVKPVRDLGHHVDTVAVYDPISPAGGVHTWLRERPASLVVVSTHARSGLARIVFGSVAARIVHHSPAPVLVVPRTD
ncbi:MAG: universal stress protein [Actinobacteria bacterium]|nr:universal stress protein [Actinomycetota bacterium]